MSLLGSIFHFPATVFKHFHENLPYGIQYITYLGNNMNLQSIFIEFGCHLYETSLFEVSQIAPNGRGYLGHSDKRSSSSLRGRYENILLCVILVWYMGGIKTIRMSIEITGLEIELLKHYGR